MHSCHCETAEAVEAISWIHGIASSRTTLLAMTLALCFLMPFPLHARTRTGLDVLENNGFKQLRGRKIALVTNHTARTADGRSIVDVLHRAKGVTLVSILSPEHGFRGDAEHGVKVDDSTDTATGLPVHSLYGATTRPTDDMLKGANTIVFDMQDVGTRFYTYLTTMAQAMEAASRKKMRFIVLDRPNPIRGDIIEGDLLDSDIKRMTGYFEIPVRHGLTPGELALWYNKTKGIGADVQVVRVENWKRNLWFGQTGLPFVPPSPNIKSETAALLYSGIGCFEATNVAVGRGTETPFELVGAPWMNGKALAAHLREKNFPGAIFEAITFTPKKDLYSGELCQGVRIIVTDRNAISPLEIFVAAFLFLEETNGEAFKPVWEEVRVVTGSNRLKEASEGRWRYDDLVAYYRDRAAEFARTVVPFLLY
jgi:uncharacterized protein YbbC (DUF1343 family)